MIHLLSDINASVVSALAEAPDSPALLTSSGGCTSAARAAADLMAGRRVTAAGHVESAAVPVFAAGADRRALAATTFLWHEPYTTPDAGETWHADTHALYAHSLRSWFDWACELLAARTRRTTTHWRRVGRGAGTEFTVEQALRWGLVDRVVTRP